MSGRLYIVCGAPGSGKSAHAQQLAQARNAVLLELDTVSEPIVQAALRALNRDPDDRDSTFYKDTFRAPVYDALFALAAENLPHADVVIVGPFTRELRDPDWPEALKKRFKTEAEIHYVCCDSSIRFNRIRRRANPRDNGKLTDWSTHKSYYAGAEEPAFPCLRIDTGH